MGMGAQKRVTVQLIGLERLSVRNKSLAVLNKSKASNFASRLNLVFRANDFFIEEKFNI